MIYPSDKYDFYNRGFSALRFRPIQIYEMTAEPVAADRRFLVDDTLGSGSPDYFGRVGGEIVRHGGANSKIFGSRRCGRAGHGV